MRGSKDVALVFTARALLNRRLRAVGDVTDLRLDTGNHTLHLRVALRGESEPLDIAFSRYDVQPTHDGALLTFGDAVASREWLAAALREFAVGRAFHVPRRTAVLLKLLT